MHCSVTLFLLGLVCMPFLRMFGTVSLNSGSLSAHGGTVLTVGIKFWLGFREQWDALYRCLCRCRKGKDSIICNILLKYTCFIQRMVSLLNNEHIIQIKKKLTF
jgi:hypothetical protein